MPKAPFSDAALSPLDGRYRAAVAPLLPYFSEQALNRARLQVEVDWLIALCGGENDDAAQQGALLPGTPVLSADAVAWLRGIPARFANDDDAITRLAEIEAVTVHDVKAVEYYLAEQLAAGAAAGAIPDINPALIHFALTSEDVNNLAYALNVRDGLREVWLPAAQRLVEQIATLAREQADTPMLARTHGQPATPTTLGKELAVFAARLGRQLRRIEGTEFLGKFSGATGTFAAHYAAAPDVDWPEAARQFVESYGLTFTPLTTQIESHDWLSELFADVVRFGRILHNFATDVWAYISIGYFKQAASSSSVGSSTMPHKINPIRFENAEANLEISAALFEAMASTLVTSRWQRDLTDSTTLRNIGVAFGHSLLAISNVAKGLTTLAPDLDLLAADLDSNWEVLAEAVQTAMRAASIAGLPGFDNPYERLKELTRGRRLDAATYRDFVHSLNLPGSISNDDGAEARLLALTPATYTGAAAALTRKHLT